MIYLVRHGQTDWNLNRKVLGNTDIPLNENGRKQAKAVSEDISKLKIDRIISSDLLRAKETAEIINQKVGAKITLDKRLREAYYGEMEGKPVSTLTEEEKNIFNRYPEKVKGEPKENVYKRIKSFLDELNVEKNDENILIVTHGGALRMMKYYANNQNEFNSEQYINCIKGTTIANTQLIQWRKS